MAKGRPHRQHSKSELIRATAILFAERAEAEAKVRRRLYVAIAAAFVVGLVVGGGLVYTLR